MKGTTVYTNEAALRLMRVGGGFVVNFTSGAALKPYPRGAHYSAAKGAVAAWTRAQHLEQVALRAVWAPPTPTSPVMVFLASPGSGFITGQIIAVNGGMETVR